MKNRYYILLLTFSLFCCKKEGKEPQQETYNIFYDSIPKNNKRVKILALKAGVKNKINSLQSFTITSEYIDSLNIAPFSEISEITYILNEQLDELTNQLDPSLRTKGVLSRIKQMETYSNAINFEISKNHRDTIIINNHIIKVIESYNNLITQLNETRVIIPKEIEKALKKSSNIQKDTIEGVPLF